MDTAFGFRLKAAMVVCALFHIADLNAESGFDHGGIRGPGEDGCSNVEGDFAKLAAGQFDGDRMVEFGGQHKRSALGLKGKDLFVTSCAIKLKDNIRHEQRCDGGVSGSAFSPHNLVSITSDGESQLFLNIWSHNNNIFSERLDTVASVDGWVYSLGTKKKEIKIGNNKPVDVEIYLYIDPRFEEAGKIKLSGDKYYIFEEFFGDKCSIEKPLTDPKLVEFSGKKNDKGTDNHGGLFFQEANTTEGGEPHHP